MSGNGKVALVTGAGTGVGRAAAIALLKAGYSVALAGRRVEVLDETAEMSGAAERALSVPTDVADADAVHSLFETTVQKFGRLDVTFNNAGMGAPAVDMDELSVEQWKTVVDVNLTGVFLCVREAFRVMKNQDPQGGRIINNGSISAYTPRPFSIAYTATKHGVAGITKTTAIDGRRYNICCNQIDIGNAGTPMTARMSDGVPQPDGSVRPEPTMDANHVGDAIVHMASLPLDASIQTMTIMANQMPYLGRG